MPLLKAKTKIVATIGPASAAPAVLERMIQAGLSVARLNFSHGDLATHGQVIANLRAAEKTTGRRIAIMADLPGPKMRIGQLGPESIELKRDDPFILTTAPVIGNQDRVSVSFAKLPEVVSRGDQLYLNDGLVQLAVEKISGPEVHCRVVVGGELRSRKGLNLPRINLGISAFTERDRECLRFALAQGVDAVSQSFVETAADLEAVRAAAAECGRQPFLVAKIERASALAHLEPILQAADGIMVARGDLGVEVPIEQIPIIQKDLIRLANRFGKPVITATQMLESMTTSRLPTRAEATDVANAVLDGTDAVMLSAESAMGRYPVEAVQMLVRIAQVIESHRPLPEPHSLSQTRQLSDVISHSVENLLSHLDAAAVLVPTRTGQTARLIARFKPKVWIAAVCPAEPVCQGLRFSYGVEPLCQTDPPNWNQFGRDWVRAQHLSGQQLLFVAGPSPAHPDANFRVEAIQL